MGKNLAAKRIMAIMAILLAVCIVLLIVTCLQCKIPNVTKYHGKASKDTEIKKFPVGAIPLNINYDNIIYTGELLIPANEIGSQIGVTDSKNGWDAEPVYKIKGVDPKRAIATLANASGQYYFQWYNNKYWLTQVPKIITYTILILFISVGMFIFYRAKFKS